MHIAKQLNKEEKKSKCKKYKYVFYGIQDRIYCDSKKKKKSIFSEYVKKA